MIPENVYGSRKRLEWICSRLDKESAVVDLGCGTGLMVTIPLIKLGYRLIGVDDDEASVSYGRNLLKADGLDAERIQTRSLAKLAVRPDVIIASEVLEHLPQPALSTLLAELHRSLRPGGRLLVTVPNGYGWFEWESFLWYRVGLGRLLEWTLVAKAVTWLKLRFLGPRPDLVHPSSLSPLPHVQAFTFDSIQSLLRAHGFEVVEISGSVLFCGPFTNLLFTGIGPVMRANAWLGSRFPRRAAGFFVSARTAGCA